MFAEDLDAFTADFGVPVQFAGAPATLHGLEDVADQDVLGRWRPRDRGRRRPGRHAAHRRGRRPEGRRRASR
jgi:hypothetical protein